MTTATAAPLSDTSTNPVAARLTALRAKMRAASVDALWIGSGDPYLSEYVPVDESLRAYLTGFTGSMGDALVTLDRAILVVDGRYRLQASQEAPNFERIVVPLGATITDGWLDLLAGLTEQGVGALGLETQRAPCSVIERVREAAEKTGLRPVLIDDSLVESVRRDRNEESKPRTGKVFPCPAEIAGTVSQRLQTATPLLKEAGVDGQILVALDELAWAVNARGDFFPFQATFPGRAVVFSDRIVLEVHDVRKNALRNLRIRHGANEFDWSQVELTDSLSGVIASLVDERGALTIGFDPATTTEAARASLAASGAKMVATKSPFHIARTTKSKSELAHMVSGFHRADVVAHKLKSWLGGAVSRGESITEKDVSEKLQRLYKRSGAWGLSFRPICGADAHGAIIHYGTPDDKTPLKEGALFLCDSGGYYEGGYATDLTRTFVVGKNHVEASERHKRLFTLVLKSAIAGMRGRFPKSTSGERFDAIIRAPLWAAGLDYAHGTGHGVGVNVHEFPPRIAPNMPVGLLPGQVFSIEPGLYLDGELGIRIENLCTIEEDAEDANFLRIRPLTFSPLDKRLIDRSMLTAGERAFLTWFNERWSEQKKDVTACLSAPLPPLAP